MARHNERVAMNVDRILKERGLTRTWLADKLETHRANVTKWLQNDRAISGERIDAIARVLGVKLDDLFRDEQGGRAKVPIVGLVAEGAAVTFHAGKRASLEMIEEPLGILGMVAVEVTGNSLAPRYPPGLLLYYQEADDVGWDVADGWEDGCLVKLKDGRAFVRVVGRGSRMGLWSLSPVGGGVPVLVDTELLWAAPITYSGRRRKR